MIKASAGGGGKGLRIAWNDSECRYADSGHICSQWSDMQIMDRLCQIMKGTCAFLHYTHTDFVLQNIRLFQLWLCNFTVVEWILVIVEQFKGSMKEPNKFHNYETEKITRKASDAAEYIELFGFTTRDRHA